MKNVLLIASAFFSLFSEETNLAPSLQNLPEVCALKLSRKKVVQKSSKTRELLVLLNVHTSLGCVTANICCMDG